MSDRLELNVMTSSILLFYSPELHVVQSTQPDALMND
jgi:hypothetical protein